MKKTSTPKLNKSPITARQVYAIPAYLRDYKRDDIDKAIIEFDNGTWIHNSMLYRMHTKMNGTIRDQSAFIQDAIEETEVTLLILKDIQRNLNNPETLHNKYWIKLDKNNLPVGPAKQKLIEEIKRPETDAERADRVLRYVEDFVFFTKDHNKIHQDAQPGDYHLLSQYVLANVEGATTKFVDFLKSDGSPCRNIPLISNPDKKLKEGPALLFHSKSKDKGVEFYIQQQALKETELKALNAGLFKAMLKVKA